MADFMAHTLVSDSNKDVLLLQNMLEQAEKEECERKNKTKLAGEIFEEEKDEGLKDSGSLDSWLNQIQEKDSELRRIQEQKNSGATGKLPPVRNSRGKEKKVQIGPSDIEKQKAEKGAAKKMEDGMSKNQKYYQYDYFKEWDKFDVDRELTRLDDEEKKKEDFSKFSKKTADPFEGLQEAQHNPGMTYDIDAMTPLERRMAAQREKEKGNECMRCGETNAATVYYSKSLELSPGDHFVLGNRAQAYIGIHCYLQAEMDCDQALAIEPTYHKARYRRAVACSQQGKYQEAVQDLEELVKHSDDQKCIRLLEECRKKHQVKQAEEERKKRVEEERQRYEAAPRRKIAIQEIDDDDDDEEEEDLGLDKKAMSQARESVRLKQQEEERLLKLEAAKRKKEEGNAAVKKRDFTNAVRQYTSALKVLPMGDKTESYLILSNRAHVYLQQGEYDLAEEDCTAALESNPSWAKARHRRGVARSNLGRYNEALEDFEVALKLEGDSKQTMDEIRKVRQLQAEKRREEAASQNAPKRVQIEEVEDSDSDDVKLHKEAPTLAAPKRIQIEEVEDSDSDGEVEVQKASPTMEGDTDSSDEDVIVIDKSRARESPSRVKRVPIVEVDDDEEEEEGCVIDDHTAVTAAPSVVSQKAPSAHKDSAQTLSSAQKAPALSEASKTMQDTAKPAGTPKSPSTSTTSRDEEISKPAPDDSKTCSPMQRVRVEIIESDSDDESDDGAAAHAVEPERTPVPEPEPVVEEKVAVPWEIDGRDALRLAKAKGLKDEADALFKNGLFEQAAEAYFLVVSALGEEDEYARERALCYNNRAACRLQFRDYGAAIADCMEVLWVEPQNIKALVRRALAQEGLERFPKAAVDCREVLSIEFAAGVGLSNMGVKARDCLQRCKKHVPELSAISIPVKQFTARHSPSLPAESGGLSAHAAAVTDDLTKLEAQAHAIKSSPAPEVEAAASRAHQAFSGIDDSKTPPIPAKQAIAHEDMSKGSQSKKGSGAAAESEAAPKSYAERQRESSVREAMLCKERGNAAFKAGKHHNAIMHYSAAIDLVDDDAAFYTNLAAAHFALKDFSNALRMAEKALKLDGRNAKGHYRKGQALEGMGQLKDSEAAFAAGVEILPASVQLNAGLKGVREKLLVQGRAEEEALRKIKQMEKIKQESITKENTNVSALNTQAPQVISGSAVKAPAGGSLVTATAFKKQCKVLKRDSAKLYDFLRTVPSAGLGKVLISGVEEDELVPVLRALEQHGLSQDPAFTFNFLQGISRVPRVGIVCKMLDRKDSKMLETMLLRLHPAKAAESGADVSHSVQDWADVRKTLGV